MSEELKPQVTVAELNALVEEYVLAEKDADEKDAISTEANKKVQFLKGKMAAYLDELKQKNYKSPYGSFSYVEKWSVATPKENADKLAFFEWCKERGIYEKYVTVNSQSLNSLYSEEVEAAKAKGEFLVIPGIGAPSLQKTIRFTRVKK